MKICVGLLLLFRRYTRYSIAYDETSWGEEGGGIRGMQKTKNKKEISLVKQW